MRFRLDPFSPTGVSVVEKQATTPVQQSHGYIGDAGLPKGGSDNQILQKSGTGSVWGVALTVSDSQPDAPAPGDLWVDTT